MLMARHMRTGLISAPADLSIFCLLGSIPSPESEKPVAFCEMVSIESKLVHEVLTELNGKYFDIMYGKSKK